MKTVLCAICLLCASSAFGQAAGAATLSGQPQSYAFDSHVLHASRVPMAQEQDLNGGSAITIAQGERPLWEVAQQKHEVPLGDVARAYRAQRAAEKKSTIHMENW